MQPERPSGWVNKPGWTARRQMVAAANPLATEAGHQMLRAGGSALDAAIAAQMVLTLVEPQSSGIGGGALLMHFDGRRVPSTQAWDGRETAPAAADERLFLGADGRAPAYAEAVFGGRAVATPGVVKMLEAAHRQHGALPWARLFEPAITLAEQGFAVSPRLHSLLQPDRLLRRDPLARKHYYAADGNALPVGHVLRNPALAAVLRTIATQGSAGLHTGPVAADVLARVQQHPVPGRLAAADLAGYQPLQREPLCTLWRTVYRVCGFPPPSSGHLAMLQVLGMMEAGPPARLAQGVPDVEWLHRYIEATRLAYADRALYVADPAYAAAPAGDWASLLQPAYLAQRAALITPQRAAVVEAGRPPGTAPLAFAPMPVQPETGTSHISVVDAQGRAVALTSSVESAFGARVMSDGGTGLPGGFLLNNHLTDFALAPTDAQGRPVANRIQPGKRPRSSMSPTLVFDAKSGELLMTLGSPGGSFIIHFTGRTLLGTLAWGLNAQQAIDLPHFGSTGGPVWLEKGRFPPATVQALRARGHTVNEIELTSGLQAVQRTPGGWFGAADPRREGIVLGD
jgi:gamma-glutamyltranspeptidase/glutathione hydrolase